MNSNITTIHQALKSLAGVCDGASSHDAKGYNGVDTHFGKDLAAKQSLTVNQAKAALKMLRKYQGQLNGFGIILPKEVEQELTIQINFNRSWFVIYFSDIPSLEYRNEMKSLEGKYYPEKNNSWVLPNNDSSVEFIYTLQANHPTNITEIVKQVVAA